MNNIEELERKFKIRRFQAFSSLVGDAVSTVGSILFVYGWSKTMEVYAEVSKPAAVISGLVIFGIPAAMISINSFVETNKIFDDAVEAKMKLMEAVEQEESRTR